MQFYEPVAVVETWKRIFEHIEEQKKSIEADKEFMDRTYLER